MGPNSQHNSWTQHFFFTLCFCPSHQISGVFIIPFGKLTSYYRFVLHFWLSIAHRSHMQRFVATAVFSILIFFRSLSIFGWIVEQQQQQMHANQITMLFTYLFEWSERSSFIWVFVENRQKKNRRCMWCRSRIMLIITFSSKYFGPYNCFHSISKLKRWNEESQGIARTESNCGVKKKPIPSTIQSRVCMIGPICAAYFKNFICCCVTL